MTTERDHQVWLRRHVLDWESAGLITQGQAGEILHYEHADDAPEAQRLTVVAEVASYLGSLIAFAGGAAIIGPNWDDIGLFGQALVAVAIAAVGFATGTWLVRQGDAAMGRLGAFLWVIGTGGAALLAGGVVDELDPADEAWFPVVIGLVVLLIGAGLWRNLDRPLQLATTALGTALVGGGIVSMTDVSAWVASPVLWSASLGAGWLAATERLRPRLVALAIAAVGLMGASFSLMEASERTGAIAAVASATLIVTYALTERSWPLVGLGVLAFFVAITTLMSTVVQSTAGRLVAVALGLAVVAAVAVRAQRSGDDPPGTGDRPSRDGRPTMSAPQPEHRR